MLGFNRAMIRSAHRATRSARSAVPGHLLSAGHNGHIANRRPVAGSGLELRPGRGTSAIAAQALTGASGNRVDRVEITNERQLRRDGGSRIHRSVLPFDEVTEHEGIPITTVPRTLLDLAVDTAAPPTRSRHERSRASRASRQPQPPRPPSPLPRPPRHRQPSEQSSTTTNSARDEPAANSRKPSSPWLPGQAFLLHKQTRPSHWAIGSSSRTQSGATPA